ncbi:TIP120-domain-containing protein [Clavulina sp. PMI_390]|nr:TIP120-domain-containing protein [Clavulina sp. PMI_390]
MAPKMALINSYMTKMEDPDMDFRFMALNDLTNTILEDPTLFGNDEGLESKTVDKVVQLVQDKNSEVKNQAVKCLGQLVKIIKESQLSSVIDNLVNFIGGKDDELRDIAGLALKTVTAELPSEGAISERACSTLTPKLVGQIQQPSTPPETVIEMLAILSILLSRFPVYLADVKPAPATTITPLLDHARIAVRKRAAVVLAQSLTVSNQSTFDDMVAHTLQPALSSSSLPSQRTAVLLLGAMGRFSPTQVGAILPSVLPTVLSLVDRDDEELRENCLQTLEALVLRCPSEMNPFLTGAIKSGISLIKYDPNYNEDMEDEEMADGEEDEDDEDDLGQDYSDDEDTSYKVRRSAAKLLTAIIATRPDQLVVIYRTIAPVLVMRFGEREESVRLDVWAAYTSLLQQTLLYGSGTHSKDPEAAGLKRKRADEGMDVEETPLSLLKAQIPGLLKALVRHLQPKSSEASLQAGFAVLRALLAVAPGTLTSQMTAIASVSSTIIGKPTSTTSSLLHSTVISFLDVVFSTHSPPSYTGVLPQLTPSLLKSLGEKDPRVAAASFKTFATLLQSAKPVRSGEWVDPLYAQVLLRLERPDTDAAVREQTETCLTELWLSATDLMRSKSGAEWVALRKSGRTDGSVIVVTKVAKEVDFPASWVDEFVNWTLNVIRKSSRTQRDEALLCLATLISKYNNGLPQSLVSTIISQLTPYLTLQDISHFTNSLTVLNTMLRIAPADVYPAAESEVLPIIYKCAVSQLPAGPLVENIIEFFGTLVTADPPIATRLIPGLTTSLEKAPAGTASSVNTSRCIGGIVRSEISLAAATVKDFGKSIKPGQSTPTPRVILSLHVVGEIGRFIDMTLQNDVFNNAVALFASPSQEVRAAAAFAAGNIAIGNLSAFLPVIVKQISSSDENRLLSLHALKEVVTYCSSAQLEGVADTLWPPLFENPDNTQESTRNVSAACLGRLTTANPARYLPLLHVRNFSSSSLQLGAATHWSYSFNQAKLRDDSPSIRATVVASIRYTFADPSQSYDELLAPLIVDFLSLVQDSDLTVRRLSLTALNAAARNKPALIRDQLTVLLPLLYNETVPKPELVKIVEMGPWKHKVDDGLEIRKTAYETMYTILDTSLSSIDLHAFFIHVIRGLSDDSDEIKVLTHMMLFRLAQVAPTTTSQRLDDISPGLEQAVKGAQVTKDTVKQDLERAGELQHSALRAIAALSKLSSSTLSPRFERLIESVEKGPLAREFKQRVEGLGARM